MSRPWPRGLHRCLSCSVKRDTTAYGGRALCIHCYGHARRYGYLSEFEFVGRATGRDNLARKVANLMGATWAAKQLKMPVKTYRAWCNRRGKVTFTPEVERVLKQLYRIASDPTESERNQMFQYALNAEAWISLLEMKPEDANDKPC